MEKAYEKINYENKPSTATPLGATNLNKMDSAIDLIDNRVVALSEDIEELSELGDDLDKKVDDLTDLSNIVTQQVTLLDGRVTEAESDITENAENITILENRFTGFSVAMSQGMELLFDRVDEADAKIKNNTEDIDALKIIPTASGNTAYIDDASNMNLENIIFYGESKQLQTTGKNWFDITTLTPRSATQGGTVTFDKDVAYVSSANQAYAAIRTTIEGFEIGKEYTIKFKISNYVGNQSGFTISLTTTSSVLFATNGYYGKTFTATSEELTFTVFSNWTAEFRTNTFTLSEMQLEEGAVASPYEPYSNRVASPSPDYPQPIESKTVNRVDVLGGQLLDLKANISSTLNGFSVSVESGYILKVSGTPTAVWANLTDFDTKKLPKGKYTFSVDKTPTELGVNLIGIKFRKSLADSTNVTHLITGSNKSITLERTEDYELVQIYVEGCDTSKSYNFTFKVMLNVGETALPFEPYQSQTKILATGTYRLDGIGDLKNYYDAKRGVFGEKVDRVTFDGSDDEGWSKSNTLDGRYILPMSDAKENAELLCTHAPRNIINDRLINTCAINTAKFFYINTSFSTLDEWKAHLQANPMTVVYEIAEPEEGNLISSVKDDFAEFLKLHTYKPNTVVMNGADAEMDVHYVADPRLYIDQKFETLAKAIVNQ